jgi:predicted MPP superfamily phosphohydrolase
MFPPLNAPTTLRIFLVLLLVAVVSLRLIVPAWWRVRGVRWGASGAALAIGVGFAMWVGGPEMGSYATSYWGVVVAWGLLTLLAPAVLTLPVAGAAWHVARAVTREPQRTERLSRRGVLQASCALLPGAAFSASSGGLIAANAPPRLPRVTMAFDGLHPDLVGLKILQISDAHLGACLGLVHLEKLLERVRAREPDLVLFTGDLADDVAQIQPALRMASELQPRLGVFAAMGNHEYLHDGRVTRPLYEKSPVSLLVNRGTKLRFGGATVWLAGADEPPGHPGAFEAPGARFDRNVRKCLDGAPRDAFRLLMCHRPEGFPAAAREGFHLTLSGHTHGGQVGLFGRSLFEQNDRYMWGTYERAGGKLYTTSGFGHWYPFRLGCPAEAPLIVLARA